MMSLEQLMQHDAVKEAAFANAEQQTCDDHRGVSGAIDLDRSLNFHHVNPDSIADRFVSVSTAFSKEEKTNRREIKAVCLKREDLLAYPPSLSRTQNLRGLSHSVGHNA